MVTREAPRHVPAALAVPGDTVICRGAYAIVTFVDTFSPGGHQNSPIDDSMVARRVITTEGVRWLGHAPRGAYRGVEIMDRCPRGVRFDG